MGVGLGAGVFDLLGLMGSASAHVFVHERILLEAELTAGAAVFPFAGTITSTTAGVSGRVLLRDTFNLRLGLVARDIRATGYEETARHVERDRDVAWLFGLGNRWDVRGAFVSVDWVSVSRAIDPASRNGIELHIVHVTAGAAF